MQFWPELWSKYGFSDGEAIPPGLHSYREVYCKAVNALAKKYKSEYAVAEFDRPGSHNTFLLAFVRRDKPDVIVKKCDEAMRNAIAEAKELYLDDYVLVQTSIDPAFSALLSDINKEHNNG